MATIPPPPLNKISDDGQTDVLWKGWFERLRYLINNNVISTTWTNLTGNISSAQLATAISDETGSGSAVFANTPTLVTPLLGTPTSGVLTNCTGLPISTGVAGLGTNVATALATPSSANLAAAITDETGTGALVFANTPTLVTPVLGVATGTSIIVTGDLASTTYANSLVLKDNAGTPHYWRLQVSTLGVLVTTDLGTTYP